MPVTYKTGNLLDCDAGIICQQVNCQRRMGAGLAKQIVDRYPDVLTAFVKHPPILGSVFMYQLPTGQVLANLYAQESTRSYIGEVCTDYEALRAALYQVRLYAIAHHSKVAIPYNMGCGLAGGYWSVVSRIIDAVFGQSGVEVEIWRLPT